MELPLHVGSHHGLLLGAELGERDRVVTRGEDGPVRVWRPDFERTVAEKVAADETGRSFVMGERLSVLRGARAGFRGVLAEADKPRLL